MLIDKDNLIRSIRRESWAQGVSAEKEFWLSLMDWVEEHVLYSYLAHVIGQVDEIVVIDPDLPERRIFEQASRFMVEFLGAHHASVRLYEPQTEKMLSFGSHPSEEETREKFIPLEGNIAGQVVKTLEPVMVPNLLNDERYRNKAAARRKGVFSLMAIPLEIARFSPHERDTVGVIQIYFKDKDRTFSPLEIQVATLMSKRLSFVLNRKKIHTMHKTNEKKDVIIKIIFRMLGTRGGVKLKEVFNRVIPELAEVVNLQSSALFSASNDLDSVILEAGYPEVGSYHSIGKRFAVSKEPAFELAMGLRDYQGASVHEVVTPSYILVVDPQESQYISEGLKKVAQRHNINSILYVPLSVDGELSHIITFDALDQRRYYREDEIDLFLFLGRELMKAQKMERLDDALHDFKNPAIATAGFARRLKKILEDKNCEACNGQIRNYVNILFEETSRLQELALSIYQVGSEQVVDLSEVLKRRFEINKEAIREQLKQNVRLKEGPFEQDLRVKCYPIHLERVFDNLLNNATKAIPLKGGVLCIRTYAADGWACAEITNTGLISDTDRARLLKGQGEGRGLYITNRIIRLLKGKIRVQGCKDKTTLIVKLPLAETNG